MKESVLPIDTFPILETVYFNRPDGLGHACYMNPALTLSGGKSNYSNLAVPEFTLVMLRSVGTSNILLRGAAKSS